MAQHNFVLTSLLLLLLSTFVTSKANNLDTYIVQVELPTATNRLANDLQAWYRSFLPTTLSTLSTDDEPSILYSYRHVFKGFSAKLTPQQVKAMEKIPGFISARPQELLSLHTTHSPNFLGLIQNTGFWRDSNYGQGVIIGVLDTGINPDHPSFNDDGMPPPPAKWKGVCQFSNRAACNKKLIGARGYSTVGDGTPYDENGHGTHTAGTAAGSFVKGANVFGNANGTAAGVAPRAHIVSYKVCLETCPDTAILAAMDDAIDDGVDVISMSLGRRSLNFYTDPVSAGAFTAIERGIFVSAPAGNDGPGQHTVGNGAPWLLTVGASSVDRKLRATAVLGNGVELLGESNFQPANFPSTQLPLIYPGMESPNPNASFCIPSALINIDLQGKIVVCQLGPIDRIEQGRAIQRAGGAAMILTNPRQYAYMTISNSHVLPAVHLSYVDEQQIVAYLNSSTPPTATITFQGTLIGDARAPELAAYSSRGPNLASPGILKPDIIGPGHNILAAWHVPIDQNNTNTKSNFNIIAGTSMACPHLSGVAALIKSVHPNWSPAMIKSAMMTTSYQLNLAGDPIDDETRTPANVLGIGAGHVNVLKATNPGLVYDTNPKDYIPYLCGLNYTVQQMTMIVDRPVQCSQVQSIREQELNYPSFSIVLGRRSSETYNRTVMNVEEGSATYIAEIGGFPDTDVVVEPSRLEFTGTNQSLSYEVTFRRLASGRDGFGNDGFLMWRSDGHQVRSPILVLFDDSVN